jgi:hypothetical protein
MCNGGASKSESAEALGLSTVRSVGASASTATGTWDNQRLPHHVKPGGGHLHSMWAPNKARRSPSPNNKGNIASLTLEGAKCATSSTIT